MMIRMLSQALNKTYSKGELQQFLTVQAEDQSKNMTTKDVVKLQGIVGGFLSTTSTTAESCEVQSSVAY